MKYEQLSTENKTSVKKYIKEELLSTQRMNKIPINPNEFTYSFNKGLQIQGRLKDMDNNQIKSRIVKGNKFWLKKDQSKVSP